MCRRASADYTLCCPWCTSPSSVNCGPNLAETARSRPTLTTLDRARPEVLATFEPTLTKLLLNSACVGQHRGNKLAKLLPKLVQCGQHQANFGQHRPNSAEFGRPTSGVRNLSLTRLHGPMGNACPHDTQPTHAARQSEPHANGSCTISAARIHVQHPRTLDIAGISLAENSSPTWPCFRAHFQCDPTIRQTDHRPTAA